MFHSTRMVFAFTVHLRHDILEAFFLSMQILQSQPDNPHLHTMLRSK